MGRGCHSSLTYAHNWHLVYPEFLQNLSQQDTAFHRRFPLAHGPGRLPASPGFCRSKTPDAMSVEPSDTGTHSPTHACKSLRGAASRVKRKTSARTARAV